MSYEQLPENLRAICEDRRPDLTAEQRAAYARICARARHEHWPFEDLSTGQDSNSALSEPVGTMLKELLDRLDVHLPGCEGCQGMLARMNRLGVAGCREQLDALAGELRTRAADVPMTQKIEAALHALGNGLAWRLHPLDPYPGLVAEAIRRAEAETAPAAFVP